MEKTARASGIHFHAKQGAMRQIENPKILSLSYLFYFMLVTVNLEL
jgi:hypothetical protein